MITDITILKGIRLIACNISLNLSKESVQERINLFSAFLKDCSLIDEDFQNAVISIIKNETSYGKLPEISTVMRYCETERDKRKLKKESEEKKLQQRLTTMEYRRVKLILAIMIGTAKGDYLYDAFIKVDLLRRYNCVFINNYIKFLKNHKDFKRNVYRKNYTEKVTYLKSLLVEFSLM